ncbi:MAG TPA: hypothetical protein VGC10_03930 [Sphingomonas sp.]
MAANAPITGAPSRAYSISDLSPLDSASAVLSSAGGSVDILAEYLNDCGKDIGSAATNALYAIGHLITAVKDDLDRFHTSIIGGGG